MMTDSEEYSSSEESNEEYYSSEESNEEALETISVSENLKETLEYEEEYVSAYVDEHRDDIKTIDDIEFLEIDDEELNSMIDESDNNKIIPEDMLIYYPDIKNKHYQELLYKLREFRELSGKSTEIIPTKRGEYYVHQKMVPRLLRIQDKLFLNWMTGTGKSKGIIAGTESLLTNYEDANKNRTYLDKIINVTGNNIKKIVILVVNDALRDEFIKEIICSVPEGRYNIEDIDEKYLLDISEKRNKNRKRGAEKLLKNKYEVWTYGKFAAHVVKITPAVAVNRYSNTCFAFDEIQSIKHESNKFINIDEIFSVLNDKIMDLENEKNIFKKSKIYKKMPEKDKKNEIGKRFKRPKVNNPEIYAILKYLVHNTKYSKVIISSATPAVNSPEDFAVPMSLLTNQDISKIDWNNVSIKELNKYFRGTISIVGGLNTGAVPNYKYTNVDIISDIKNNEDMDNLDGIDIDLSGIKKLYVKKMSKFQGEIYRGVTVNSESNKDNPKTLRKNEVIISNFVFPTEEGLKKGLLNGTFEGQTKFLHGKEGFEKYIKTKTFNKKIIYKIDKNFRKAISNLNLLKEMSVKFYYIVKSIINLIEDPYSGIAFISTNFKIAGGGGILLYLVLLEYGLYKYNTSNSNTKNSKFCPTLKKAESFEESMINSLKKDQSALIPEDGKYKVALLTGDEDSNKEQIIKDLKSEKNVNGGLVKIVIGTKSVSKGFSFYSVQKIHKLDGEWNYAMEKQSINRGLRSTSHMFILMQKSKLLFRKLVGNGYEIGEALTIAKDITMDVDIYLHVAYYTRSDDHKKYNKYISVDRDMYIRSERKRRDIAMVDRMFMKIAVDCPLQKYRNIKKESRPFSPECDYTKCDYECYPKMVDPDGEIIEYNKTILYSGEEKDNILEDIQDILSNGNTIFTLHSLYDYIRNKYNYTNDISMIDDLLLSVMEDRHIFYDIYGDKCYINESKGTLFFTKILPDESIRIGPELSHYVENFGLNIKRDISDVRNILTFDDQSKFIKVLDYIDYGEEEYMEALKKLKNLILEEDTDNQRKNMKRYKKIISNEYIFGDFSENNLNILELHKMLLDKIMKENPYRNKNIIIRNILMILMTDNDRKKSILELNRNVSSSLLEKTIIYLLKSSKDLTPLEIKKYNIIKESFEAELFSFTYPKTEILYSIKGQKKAKKGRDKKDKTKFSGKLFSYITGTFSKPYSQYEGSYEDGFKIEPLKEIYEYNETTDEEELKSSNKVYVHTISKKEFSGTGYGVLTSILEVKKVNIRILEYPYVEWRDLGNQEIPSITAMIKYSIFKKNEKFFGVDVEDKNKIFLIYNNLDKVYRIRDRTKENQELIQRDGKSVYGGGNITEWVINSFIFLIWEINKIAKDTYTPKEIEKYGYVINPVNKINDTQMSHKKLLKLVNSKMNKNSKSKDSSLPDTSEEALRFYLTWLDSGYSQIKFVKLVKNYLENHGLIVNL